MQRSEVNKARQQMTGGMPTGPYNMAEMQFTVWRRVPMDWIVQELASWPAEQDRSSVYFRGTLEDAARLLDQMR